MNFDDMRAEIKSIASEDGLSPTESRLLDVVDELITAAHSQSIRIQELALLQLGVSVPPAIHRVTSNYDLVDLPISLRADCGLELPFPKRIPVERLILGQRIPSFAALSKTDSVCPFCARAEKRSDRGTWESYWQQSTPSEQRS